MCIWHGIAWLLLEACVLRLNQVTSLSRIPIVHPSFTRHDKLRGAQHKGAFLAHSCWTYTHLRRDGDFVLYFRYPSK